MSKRVSNSRSNRFTKVRARQRVRLGWRKKLRNHLQWLAKQKELGLEVTQ